MPTGGRDVAVLRHCSLKSKDEVDIVDNVLGEDLRTLRDTIALSVVCGGRRRDSHHVGRHQRDYARWTHHSKGMRAG
jgi:hypothetical protein